MRRLHIRGRGNVAKRVLLQAAGVQSRANFCDRSRKPERPKAWADLKRKTVLALLRVLATLWGTTCAYFRGPTKLPLVRSLPFATERA